MVSATYNDSGIPDHPEAINSHTRVDGQLRHTRLEVEDCDRFLLLRCGSCRCPVRRKLQEKIFGVLRSLGPGAEGGGGKTFCVP